jgi:hypothetical protein
LQILATGAVVTAPRPLASLRRKRNLHVYNILAVLSCACTARHRGDQRFPPSEMGAGCA